MKRFKLQINSRIDIENNDVIYKTTIQDVVKDGFLISVPAAKGQYLTLMDGDNVILDNYAEEQSLYRLTCNVIEKVNYDNLPLYKISLPKDIKKIQRRNFVRVDVIKQVKYYKITNDKSVVTMGQALMLDLSGGGARLKIKETLHYGDKIMVSIDLEELKLKVNGEVVRIEPSEDKRNIYGIRFDELSNSDTEKIIKSVFEIMRKQRELV